ncbi:MAG: UDP-N-acetylmuramate dehydrogenase [Candidatus Pacebacteria bacterium]|nr:UDP-N-acetylmuramate dehydrogenase [Candidatus Paceibacterota bacterium]
MLQSDVPLAPFSTFKIGGIAKNFIRYDNTTDRSAFISLLRSNQLPLFVVGGGSNTIFREGTIDALFIHVATEGWSIAEENENEVTVRVKAGHNWDTFVEAMVEQGYQGVEALSAIPGTVGATPVQNVGAYGCEVKDTIVNVGVLDLTTYENIDLPIDKLGFGYRMSIFKGKAKGKYLIEYVDFKLKKNNGQNSALPIPDYPGVAEKVKELSGSRTIALSDIRNAIISIRKEKLPDPSVIPNNGSFFKNPIVDESTFQKIFAEFPDLRYFKTGESYKIPAGWLLEKAGLKGARLGAVGLYEKNALVLYNADNATFADLAGAVESISKTVSTMFGITLEQEPEFIPESNF